MVTPSTTSRDRGQLLLISAIVIAFIVLGIVVVFNGVLYTQTISSSATGQSVSDADRMHQELADGVCAINESNESGSIDDTELEALESQYQNATTASGSKLSTVDLEYDETTSVANITVSYDSSDLAYSDTQSIDVTERC